MPKNQYLDTFVAGALLDAPEVARLSEADRRVLADLAALARAFVRLDENERAAIVEDVRARAREVLPTESHVFFIEDDPTMMIPASTPKPLNATEAVERLFENGAGIVDENERTTLADAADAARFVVRLPPEDGTRIVGILRRGNRLCDLADGLKNGRVVGDAKNGAFFVD